METTMLGLCRVILGFYWDNGKENGNYYNGVIWDLGFRASAICLEGHGDLGLLSPFDSPSGLRFRILKVIMWSSSDHLRLGFFCTRTLHPKP